MKGAKTYFANGSATDPSVSQEIRLEQILLPEAAIFQDEKVPQEFKEIMILHEIRESEYKNAGFEDGHERAMNDEVLYALKFLTPKQRAAYFEFAKEYRATQAKVPAVDLDEMRPSRSLSLFYKDELHNFGESTGVYLVDFNAAASDVMHRVGRRLAAELDLVPNFHVSESENEYGHYIEINIKWMIEQREKVIVIDSDPARLAYFARMPGVHTIDANQPDVEKRMYETYKSLMKPDSEQ